MVECLTFELVATDTDDGSAKKFSVLSLLRGRDDSEVSYTDRVAREVALG